MRKRDWGRLIAGVALTAPAPFIVHAETYLTELQAAAVLFPGIKLKASDVELAREDMKAIERSSGERVRSARVRVLWGPERQALIVDQVLGKHEFITYAVAIAPEGKVQGVEIMDYRETYGYEIRREEWRRQFVGRSSANPLKLDKDIQNISGATLSCSHVAGGVRRVLQTYEILKKKS